MEKIYNVTTTYDLASINERMKKTDLDDWISYLRVMHEVVEVVYNENSSVIDIKIARPIREKIKAVSEILGE